jgi:lipid-A-disaccharide synthase
MKICIVAGEASGDKLGSLVMRELKGHEGVKIIGLGGDLMKAQGLESFFDIREISVMGVAEVAPKIFKILRLMKDLSEFIINEKPDVILTIDSPDFNFRLVKKLQKLRADKTKIYHYIAPSVWAYRAGRAKKIAKIYDGLFCILPFEPPYFEKHGLQTYFVGHPLIDDYKTRHIKPLDGDFVSITLGSRKSEIDRHLSLIKPVVDELEKNFTPVILTLPQFENMLKNEFKNNPKTLVISDEMRKLEFMKSSRFAIAKSGTNALEFSILGVPLLVYYKVHPVTAFIAKKVLKTPFANLINILAQKELVNELIQEKATPENILKSVQKLDRFPLNEVRANLEKLDVKTSPSAEIVKILMFF